MIDQSDSKITLNIERACFSETSKLTRIIPTISG